MQKVIDRINELHTRFEESKNNAVKHAKEALAVAIELGGLLTEQKNNLPHGLFGEWVKDNFQFTDRTARRWMKLHAERKSIEGAETINEAYKLLKNPRPGSNREDLETDTVSDLDNAFIQLIDFIWKEVHANNNAWLTKDHYEYANWLHLKMKNPLNEFERILIKSSFSSKKEDLFAGIDRGFGAQVYAATIDAREAIEAQSKENAPGLDEGIRHYKQICLKSLQCTEKALIEITEQIVNN